MSVVLSDATYSLPSGWYWSTIGEVADVIGGGTPRTDDPANFENGDIPWITPADLSGYTEKYISQGARFITIKGLESSSARLLPAGTVLFTSRAPIGYVAIARNPVATNQGFKSFILKPGLLSEYVFWWLKGSKQRAERLASGTTFLELSGANAKKIPIPIAPLKQQTEIVAEIEKQFSRLDQAVASLQRVKAQLKRYKASVLKAAVEGRLVETEAERARREGRGFETGAELAAQGSANAAGSRKPGAALHHETGEQLLKRILETRRSQWKGKGKYKEPAAPETSSLPELPEGWCWSSTDQLAEVGTGATPNRSNATFFDGGDIPWVTSAVVNAPFVDKASELVTRAALLQTNLTEYPPGTLLVAMYGEGKTRGKCSELRITAATNQALAAVQADPSVRSYLKIFLEHNYEETRKVASGGVQPNLNLSLVRAIRVPLPPLPEQHRIVAEVDRRLSIVREVEAEVDANLRRAERLRQSVLAAAFSGRLTGNAAVAVA